MALRDDAVRLTGNGLSVLPIERGTKKYKGHQWKEYQSRLMSTAELHSMFLDGDWLAVVCGEVSGHLEVIDFDIPNKSEILDGKKGIPPAWKPFLGYCKDHDFEELVKRLLIIETKSGGKHVVYRCPEGVEGNQKLAKEEESQETIIETRGEGGYFVTYPTPGYTIKQGSFESVPVITSEEREFLLTAARSLNEVWEEHPTGHKVSGGGLKPGEDYNQRTSWADLLESHGWTRGGRSSGNREAWVRPGKTKKGGVGATTGNGPTDLLFVHTTNAPPFEAGKSYSKFAAYAFLHHGKDFIFAAQALKEKGFGKQPAKTPGPDTHFQDLPDDKPKYNLRKASEVEAKPVDWLLYPYIPKGMLSGCEGVPGLGKTFVMLSLAAALSRGVPLEFMDLPAQDPATVIYWTLDDSAEYVLKPRLQRMEGDFNRIILCDDSLVLDRQGLRDMKEIIKETGAKWFILDPLAKFIDPVLKNPRSDISLSEIMTTLKAIVEETGCAITPVRHLRKGRSGDVISDGYGGIEIIGGYRSALRLDQDPDNPPRNGSKFGIVSHIKSNIGPIGTAFAYEIRPVNKELAEIWWAGTRDFDPATASLPMPETVEIKDAKAFLLHELCFGQAELSTVLEEAAAKQGITKKMLRTAREQVCEAPQRIGYGKDQKVFYRLKSQFTKVDPYAS